MDWKQLLNRASEEVGDAVKSRMQKPFVVAFLLSWAVVNYAALIALFGTGDYAKRVDYIKAIYANEDATALLIWKPLFGVAAYFLLVPLFNLAAIFFQEVAEISYSALGFFLDRKKFVPRSEQAKMYADHDELLRKANDENEQLRRSLAEASKDRGELLAACIKQMNDTLMVALKVPGFDWPDTDLVPTPYNLRVESGFPSADVPDRLPREWLAAALHFKDMPRFSISQFEQRFMQKCSVDHASLALQGLRAAGIIQIDWTGSALNYRLAPDAPLAVGTALRLN